MSFELHPRLAADTVALGELPLSSVRLVRDARYPWVLLVPKRPGLTELHDLVDADGIELSRESAMLSKVMASLFAADKMNVAVLGNIVSQLHVHHVARHEGDDAWPGPVWGAHPPKPYDAAALLARVDALRGALASAEGFEPAA